MMMAITLPTLKALGDPYSLLALACAVLGITAALISRSLADNSAKGGALNAINIAVVIFAMAAFGVNVIRVQGRWRNRLPSLPNTSYERPLPLTWMRSARLRFPFGFKRRLRSPAGPTRLLPPFRGFPRAPRTKALRLIGLTPRMRSLAARPWSIRETL